MKPATKVVLPVLGIASLIPIWRSGLQEDLNFWEFILNHTIYGPAVEYIPEEDYIIALSRRAA